MNNNNNNMNYWIKNIKIPMKSRAWKCLIVAWMMAYWNDQWYPKFPFFSIIPFQLVMFRYLVDTLSRDKIIFLLVYTLYYIIIMYPISSMLRIPYIYSLLWIYSPLFLIYERTTIGMRAYPDHNNTLFRYYLTLFWDPPLLLAMYTLHYFQGQAFPPLVSIIDDDICMGPLPTHSVVLNLYKEGPRVRAVINMCEEYAGPYQTYQRYGMKCLYLPCLDCCQPSLFNIWKGIRFIEEFIQQKQQNNQQLKGSRIFIHCKGGQGRSTTLVLCWLIYKGWNPKKAMQYIIQCRKVVSPRVIQYPVVRQFIKEYSTLKR